MKKKIFCAVVVLFVGFRLYLPTLVKNYANKELNRDPLYRGNIDDVGIHLWRGAYSAYDFKIEEVKGPKSYPFIAAKEIDVGLSWRDLFHRTVVAKIDIDGLEINIVREPKPEGSKVTLGAETKEGKKVEAAGWQSVVKKLVPLDINILRISGDSVHFRDLTSKPNLNVYFDKLQVSATNLTNSHKIAKTLFGEVNLNARAMKSGDFHLLLLVNPLVSPPEFKATTTLKNLNLTELNPLFTAYGNFDVKQGSFSLYSEVATAKNNLKGYVKPLTNDLKVTDFEKDKKKGIIHAFWEDLVGLVAGIFKNYPKERQAAIIPFEGRLDQPKVDGWETAKSILRNMFVNPISPKIDHTVKLNDVKKKN